MAKLLLIPVLALGLGLAFAVEAKAWTFSFQYSVEPGYLFVDEHGLRHQGGYSGFTYSYHDYGRYPPYYKPYYRNRPYGYRYYRDYGPRFPYRYYNGWKNWSRHGHERRHHRGGGDHFPSHRPRHRYR